MSPNADKEKLPQLLLLGGGHSHVEVLRRFGLQPPAARVTVVSRELWAPYSGMLPGLIAGTHRFAQAHIELPALARFAGARLVHAEVTGLDPHAGRVRLRDGRQLRYDLLSLNLGATPDLSTPGAAAHALPVKPIDRFFAHWQSLLQRLQGAPAGLRLAVVGGGAAGVELLLAARQRLRRELPGRRVAWTLFSRARRLLPGHGRRAGSILAGILRKRGVRLRLGCAVHSVEAGRLLDQTGCWHAFDALLWVTGAVPAGWLRRTGLALDPKGFIEVDTELRSTSHPAVFAAGDVATLRGAPRPRAGVFAVRMGGPLAENLRAVIAGTALRPYRQQRRFLSLLGTADGQALASWGGWSYRSRGLARLKAWIDRRFIQRYAELPSSVRSRQDS